MRFALHLLSRLAPISSKTSFVRYRRTVASVLSSYQKQRGAAYSAPRHTSKSILPLNGVPKEQNYSLTAVFFRISDEVAAFEDFCGKRVRLRHRFVEVEFVLIDEAPSQNADRIETMGLSVVNIARSSISQLS